MNRRHRRKIKESKLKQVILAHIENNIKSYAIVSIVFLIGVVIGVIFINNISANQSTEIINYITSFSQDLKENQNINNMLLLKETIRKNVVLAIFLWFMGSTVIGIFAVYFIICFRGFCLGYTISSTIISLGIRKRDTVFNIITFTSNNFIYSVYISTCSKWNEA